MQKFEKKKNKKARNKITKTMETNKTNMNTKTEVKKEEPKLYYM